MQSETAASLEEELQHLRLLFEQRLLHDRAKLRDLAAKLASADASPGGTVEEIRRLAHRLYGAAAISAAHELSRSARALEVAATNVATGCADELRAPMSSLLEILDRLSAAN